MKRASAILPLLLSITAFSQTPGATEPVKPGSMAAPPQAAPWQNLIGNLEARNVGPTNMGGRVSCLAVYDKEPRIFYVGSASGGLWKTENGGITLIPVFYREGSVSLGAAAVSQKNPNLIWVGTGEQTSRNSVAWGDGVYRSTDGGKTWQNMGLVETRHIGAIVIDPKDENTVYVGAMGHLWGKGKERGVYKTTDGGKTWKQLLFVNDLTGVIDMQMDPRNPNTLLVATYEHQRFPYNYVSGGVGSAIYKTTDGGRSFRKLTKGLPDAPYGRIGLNYFRKNPRVVIASIEAKKEGGLYQSTDGGESWKKLNALDPRPFYFSVPRIDPLDENRMYLPAVSLHYSEDGGKTFRAMNSSVHVDHHAMWIDPADSNHILIGEDGGLAQTRDRGVKWEHINSLPIGQFYAVAFDYRRPFWIYGGLQDNGSWGIPTQTTHGGVAFWDATNVGGGDGFHVQVDPTDWRTVYSESQGGAMARTDLKGGNGRFVGPRIQGEPLRFNWSTPFILSPHNPRTLYAGANRLMKSVDRGDHWKPVSPDLTTNDPTKLKPGEGSVSPENTGAEAHCTIVTVNESPMKQGVVYVGTDDGLVWITKDDGTNWEQLTKNIPDLPANTWCSRVLPSKWAEGRVYATFDGHRTDDFKPYVYVSEDYGKTWSKLNAGLPDYDNVYVVREGDRNADLLYLGSEMSLRFSFDRGKTWARYRGEGWPTVAVHDVAVHPRDLDLVIGTHGRSMWLMDVSGIEQLDEEARKQDAFLCKPHNVLLLGRMSEGAWEGDRVYTSSNTQPGTQIQYYLKKDMTGDAKIVVSDAAGKSTTSLTGPVKAGLNVVKWNGRLHGRTIDPGDYRVVLTVGGKDYTTSVHVDTVSDEVG